MFFLYLSAINILIHWTEACTLLKKNDEVFWIGQPSTIDLHGKDAPRRIDNDEPRVIRLALKPDPPAPRPRDNIDEQVRQGSARVDAAVRKGIKEVDKTVEEGLKEIGKEIERKKRKRRGIFSQILIKVGLHDDDRRKKRRVKIRKLSETSPAKPAVVVRVHPPPKSIKPDSNPPPPIVYAPPLREEKYPPPGVGVPYYAKHSQHPVSIASTEVEISRESDEELPNKRFRRRYREDLEDASIHRIHITVKESKHSKETPAKRDDDIVRKVHFERNPQPIQRQRLERPGARLNKKRGSSRPIPVVFR